MLEVQTKNIDNEKWYYYNITKKSSLEQLLEKKQVTLNCVETILMQIFYIIDTAKDFLLDERNLVLETKMIYLSADNPVIIELCYYPSYQKDNMEQIIRLLEVFLNKVDYKKEEKSKVEHLYKLYDKARENGMTCKELCKELRKEYGHKESKTKKEETPIFHFERVEKVVEQADGVEQNKISQHIEAMEKTTLKEKVYEKQKVEKKEQWKREIKKTDIKKRASEKQTDETRKSKKRGTFFQIKNLLTICFILIFTCVIIGTALFTNIFYNFTTGTLDYKKFGILCVIIVLMDLFAWKYLKQEEIEKAEKTAVFHQAQNKKKPKNRIEKTLKDDNEELEFMIAQLEQSDITGNMPKTDITEKTLQPDTQKNVFYEEEEIEGTQLLVEEPTILLAQEETMLLQPIEQIWKLVSLEEKDTKEILLEKFPFYLGKLQWNVDYAIDHPSISRIHSKFEKAGDILYVTDLDSTNGTYLNHIKLGKDEKKEIKEGDEISFADVKFRLEIAE